MVIDAAQFRVVWALDDDIDVDRLKIPLDLADQHIKQLVGVEAYEDATADVPDNPARAAAIKVAGMQYGMARLIPFLAGALLPSGLASSTSSSSGTHVTFATTEERQAMIDQLTATADQMLDAYLMRPGPSEIALVGLIDPFDIAERADAARPYYPLII